MVAWEQHLFFTKAYFPEFAAFVLIQNSEGRAILEDFFQKYISIAKEHSIGLVLETPTWRVSSKWKNILGYSEQALEAVNQEAIELLVQIRDQHESDKTILVSSGYLGPEGETWLHVIYTM